MNRYLTNLPFGRTPIRNDRFPRHPKILSFHQEATGPAVLDISGQHDFNSNATSSASTFKITWR